MLAIYKQKVLGFNILYGLECVEIGIMGLMVGPSVKICFFYLKSQYFSSH